MPACGPNPLVSWSDEKLLLSYRAERDGGVFDELVHRYEKELFGYLRHYLGNAEMAEDVFQQTFLQVHLKCDQFEPGRKVRPWLYTIATNQAIDYRRRNRRHRMSSLNRAAENNAEEEARALAELLGGPESGPADNAESAEQNDALRRAVDALARAIEASSDARVLSRIEVRRGRPGLVRSRGNGQEPVARRDAQTHGVAFAGSFAEIKSTQGRVTDRRRFTWPIQCILNCSDTC